MAFADLLLLLVIAPADSIHGCGGFVQTSPGLIRTRKASDAKLDYSHVTVELRTVAGLLKDKTQCAPNGYYFIPVYDKGSFIVKVRGPSGWSWEPEHVPVVIDQNGCNANADTNFQFTGFMISGRVKGAVGGESCSLKNGGPPDVKVELLSPLGDPISSVPTIRNRGMHICKCSSRRIQVTCFTFKGNPILGVHVYLHSEHVSEVHCPQGSGKSPSHKTALCLAISDADGKFMFKSIPCGLYELLPYYKGDWVFSWGSCH